MLLFLSVGRSRHKGLKPRNDLPFGMDHSEKFLPYFQFSFISKIRMRSWLLYIIFPPLLFRFLAYNFSISRGKAT